MEKLTKKQQEILSRLRCGEKCLKSRLDYYWFMANNFEKCTKQIQVLKRMKLIITKGSGMWEEIVWVSQKDGGKS